MHDIRAVREDPAGFDAALGRRGLAKRSQELIALDAERREMLTFAQSKQTTRNSYAKEIGQKKRQGGDTAHLEKRAQDLRDEVANDIARAERCDRDLAEILEKLPNRLDDDVPKGADESYNVVVRQSGEPKEFGFAVKQHFELGEALGLMDFEAAGRISGARFTILRGGLARLERALGQFMIDLHVDKHGYQEMGVPGLVKDAALYGTGQLPKFAEDCFHTGKDFEIDDLRRQGDKADRRWLIPTAEVPLTNTVADQIVPLDKLPIRMTALTDCYRSEAGAAGRDTRGMLRQHQFRKVEMVTITTAEESKREHERMTGHAEKVLENLGLPYRRMLLCAGDTGFSAAKTFDLEVWLPGQGMWREISSCSNCRDFQARRMNARYRLADGKTIRHVHTLNGSGVAVGRALIAVMENYQQADGSITVPEVLRGYMGDTKVLRAG